MTLRILLSAYACEPGKGSEPGVGWNWAIGLAERGHSVWVLTRRNNRQSIERKLHDQIGLQRLRLNFIYYDLPDYLRQWKKGRRGIHLYYLLWQWGAYRFVKKWHATLNFNLVHHVTFVSIRQPSFMGRLGIPFIFGPVAGGELIPWRLRSCLDWRGWAREAVRDFANQFVRIDPLMHYTFTQATIVYTTSAQTRSLVPKRFLEKCRIQLAIAAESLVEPNKDNGICPKVEIFRILYAGNFISLKGMTLGLYAFARLKKKHPSTQLTMIGHGPAEKTWKVLTKKLGIDDSVSWNSWLPQKELVSFYRSHDLFLFPSLRDSGGMAALEAMSQGLPVVCFKLGGPSVLVDNTCGRVIDVRGDNPKRTIAKLYNALSELSESKELLNTLSAGAIERARQSTWSESISRIYDIVEN
jgi:glycosyltransferase involved in cell wall biosynthesis